jgi:uncharacterized protein (TIGR03086 family)
MFDLEPASRQVAELLGGVADEQLPAPTPCEDYSLGELLDHFMGLTLEFRNAASKATLAEGVSRGPGAASYSAANLPEDWRERLAQQLDDLAQAWKDPSAWEGMTRAGGLDLPAEVAAMVALDELVLHGWDLARATGQPFECDATSTEVCFKFTSLASEPGADRRGLFGPVVEVPADAPLLHRALGLSGRNPAWSATST